MHKENSSDLKKKSKIAFIKADACAAGWLLILLYLWIALGDRGLYADATNTGGYTTLPEFALLILAIVLFVKTFLYLRLFFKLTLDSRIAADQEVLDKKLKEKRQKMQDNFKF